MVSVQEVPTETTMVKTRLLPLAPAFTLLLVLSSLAAGAATGQAPSIRRDVHHDVSPPLVELIRNAPVQSHHEREAEPRHSIPLPPGLTPIEDDPVRQPMSSGFTPQLGLSFEGIGNNRYGFTVEEAPPDTNGAVGLTQYVQWVNTVFAIFDKSSGALLAGPTPGNVLWSGFGGGCDTNNDGDPVVVYDKLANRWVMSQLSVSTFPYMQCIAVSATADATGVWYRYAFQYSYLDDYPKMGVWPDAYYETFNMFDDDEFVGADVCAYNRAAMLSGQAATQVCFQQNASVGGLLPSDMDGTTPPPAGSPNYFLTFGANSLQLYRFHVDFNNPSNSTFTGPVTIPVAAFAPLCNGGSQCVPQRATTTLLDSLADRLMYRLAYRNFGDHESLVVNHSVAVAGGGGIRWYEIQRPGSTPVVAQQGTYAPDANTRWMGSVAMDRIGDLAVGYSVSSGAIFPSIAFAGRMPSDPPGALEAETTIVSGGGSQTLLSRWGDYSAMTVDPVDDCTFWYTQEYLSTTGAWNWNTRIASFNFPGCAGNSYIGLYPAAVNFGLEPLGTTSAPQAITLSNHETFALSIRSIQTGGDFSQTNNCGSSLSPNASCTVNVSFTPAATGVRTGLLTIVDNGPGGGRSATLTGLGTVLAPCIVDTLSNGGFESGSLSCWNTGGALPPAMSTAQAHSGSFSALLGATGLPQPDGDSWMYQTITVPTDLVSPTLSFWFWPWSLDSIEYDWQEAQIRDTGGNKLAQVFKADLNTQAWTYVTFDLTPYKGQTVQLYFNVHEDGDPFGYLTYMYVDHIAINEQPQPALRFVPVPPCRVVDTRAGNGTFGGPPITQGTSRSFPIPQGACAIPANAAAYALNAAVVPHGRLGYLTLWPSGATMPVVSTLNSDGRVKANAAIVAAGQGGAISVYASNTTDVILDISGYF